MTERERLLIHAWMESVTVMLDEIACAVYALNGTDLSDNMNQVDTLVQAVIGETELKNDTRSIEIFGIIKEVMGKDK